MALCRISKKFLGFSNYVWKVNCGRYYFCHYEIPSSVFVSVRNYSLHTKLDVQAASALNVQWRNYGKKTKDAKNGKKSPAVRVALSHEELNEIIDYDKMILQMEAALEYLRKEYAEQLSLRTSVTAFDNLTVDTPDGQFPLIQIAQVLQKSPQLLVINLAASPQYITQVKTAISTSGLNVNPQQEGTTLYVPVPRVTHEHREMLAKNAKALCDKTKETLRHIQNNFDREVKKAKQTHAIDLIHNMHDTIVATTRSYVEKAHDIMETKQQELLNK